MTSEQRHRNARLRAAQKRWALEDRQRGYTTYRNGRPYRPAVRKPGQLVDTLITVIGSLVLGICLGLALTNP